jgi:hypothetical protein
MNISRSIVAVVRFQQKYLHLACKFGVLIDELYSCSIIQMMWSNDGAENFRCYRY